MKIAIDGPSGSGKTTIAQRLAKKLNILYIDTGAMYRALAYKAFCNNIDYDDEKEIVELLNSIQLKLIIKDGFQHIYINDEDVSEKIRKPEIAIAASKVSVFEKVREKMVALQRKIADNQSVIMDGRDIGSVVLKDADFKFYLTASPEVRAKRRVEEYNLKGENKDFGITLGEINKRDKDDMTRKHSPLTIAKDAIVLDTSNMSLEDVFNYILNIVNPV